jgi:hypothetical protein
MPHHLELTCSSALRCPCLAPPSPSCSLAAFPGGVEMSKERILEVSCDVLIPAAIGGVITESNARDLRCKVSSGGRARRRLCHMGGWWQVGDGCSACKVACSPPTAPAWLTSHTS